MTADSTVLYSFLDLQPVSCSIQGSDCCFLTRIQVSQETGKMVWCSCLSKSFPQLVMVHTIKGFNLVDETEREVFLKVPCFLYNLVNVGNLISSSSSFSKLNLDIWKFLVHIMLSIAFKVLSLTLLAWEISAIVWWLAHSLELPFLGIDPLEEGMANHPSILAVRTSWTI